MDQVINKPIKLSSYQKLKAKNQQLMQDLHDAIMYPDSAQGIKVKMHYHVLFNYEAEAWRGNTSDEQQNFKGLISYLRK
jgi:hypothetical protein